MLFSSGHDNLWSNHHLPVLQPQAALPHLGRTSAHTTIPSSFIGNTSSLWHMTVSQVLLFHFFFLQTSLLFFWAIPRHACSCWMCFSVFVLNFLFIFNLLIERQMLLFWFVLSTSGDESPDKDSDEVISISSYWRFTASEPYTTCKICTQKTHHHAHTPN